MINIQKFGNIEIDYSIPKNAIAYNNSPLKYSIMAMVPDNDTTGFELKVSSGKVWHHAYLYFVTTNNEFRTYPGNPKYNSKPPPTKSIIKLNSNALSGQYLEVSDSIKSLLSNEVRITNQVKKEVGKDLYKVDTCIKSTSPQKKVPNKTNQ